MNTKPVFIPLKDLEVYQLSRQLSTIAWVIYERLTYQQRKVWGEQMLTAVDSVGANIAEGYARYHYLEKIRFFYIARGSLSEGVEHWLDLGWSRKTVLDQEYAEAWKIRKTLQIKLNLFIKSTYASKRGDGNH